MLHNTFSNENSIINCNKGHIIECSFLVRNRKVTEYYLLIVNDFSVGIRRFINLNLAIYNIVNK